MSTFPHESCQSGTDEETEVVEPILLPADRAEFFYSRAKQLYELGGNHSVILERVVTTTLKAMSFGTENIDHYLFLGMIFLKAFDLSSSLFCYRYAIKINAKDLVAKKRIGDVLFLIGQEILCKALTWKKRDKDRELEMISRARAHFEECLNYDMTNKKFWVFKCLCHVYCGPQEVLMAQEAISQAILLDKNQDAEILILRSKLLWSQNLHTQGDTIFCVTTERFHNSLQ
jgi:tetratricopeptide (TPR) repeat protein